MSLDIATILEITNHYVNTMDGISLIKFFPVFDPNDIYIYACGAGKTGFSIFKEIYYSSVGAININIINYCSII